MNDRNKIVAIDYNFQTERGHTGRFELGDNVLEIVEHSAQGEGDKWYYDVIFKGKDKIRIFNPCKVYYNNQ